MFDALLLDCDGVVTNKRAQVDQKVIFEAYRLAHAGKKVAFVTGRSLDWLLRNVIPEIERLSPAASEKSRFFFIGECGNRWAAFSGTGVTTGSDDSHSISEQARLLIKNEIERFPYLFFDQTKESFASLEIRHNRLVSADAEHEAQRQLEEARAFFTAKFPQLAATRTLYAVDVMRKGVGKGSGAKRALEMMGSVSSALIIGDSEIDLEMGEELQRSGIGFEYYHVGESVLPKTLFQVKRSERHYSEGTLEILRNIR